MEYIETQIRIIKGEYPKKDLNQLQYAEQLQQNNNLLPCERVYHNPFSICEILNSMAALIFVAFLDAGKPLCYLQMNNVTYLSDMLFVLDLEDYSVGKVFQLELTIEELRLNEDQLYVISTGAVCNGHSLTPVCSHILEVLERTEPRIRLNAECLIQLQPKGLLNL